MEAIERKIGRAAHIQFIMGDVINTPVNYRLQILHHGLYRLLRPAKNQIEVAGQIELFGPHQRVFDVLCGPGAGR